VVFDPETIEDVATYQEPRQHPAGIDWVLINGRVAVEAGVQRDVRPGRVLRHGAAS
jgi:N-acyl-D-amino-acid deacylase